MNLSNAASRSGDDGINQFDHDNTGANTGRVIDPAAFLRIHLDPAIKSFTPSHWAYEIGNAILSGDSEFTKLLTTSHAKKWDTKLLVEPLGPSGQNLLHAAAIMNRAEILRAFMESVEAEIRTATEQQRTSVRYESVITKTNDDAHTRLVALGAELDKIERLYHMQCEQQYITLLSTSDNTGRTVLHYGASARGVMIENILSFRANRFRDATTSEIVHPVVPLFPANGWISPVTGELWQAPVYEFPEDHPPIVIPSGYISVEELLRARREPLFIDAKDINLATPLHYATIADDLRSIRALLEHGAETFAVTRQGATPLDLSANRTIRRTLVPVENAVQLSCGIPMLRSGVKAPLPPSASGFSKTATLKAAQIQERPPSYGGATTDAGTTVAARKSAAENALVFLVNSGEDVNGRTGIKLHAPLHVAAIQGAIDVVQLLLASGAIVDILDVNGSTPVHLAAELGTEQHMAVVKLLFDAGADINATNSTRKTPLHLASSGGPHFTAGQNLMSSDGDATKTTSADGSAGGTSDGNSAMITLLTRLGANLEAADLEGNTPLIAAAKRGNHLAVQTLLTLGARIYAQNIRGHTALHMAAFLHQLPVVHQLVRWDAEIGKLKYMMDTSGRSAYDMAADPPTREALHTLWEACSSGRLDSAQSVQRQTALLPPTAAAPWLPVRIWETTRILKRSALHCTITGAAKAMAIFRKESANAKSNTLGVVSSNRVADALSKGIAQRRDRERHVDPLKGTGLPKHKIPPSAVHILAGIGLRFVTEPQTIGPVPPQDYLVWGGNFSDVHLTFPEPLDPLAVRQAVDRYAYVPRPNAHLAFISKSLLADASRSEMAMERVKNGTELTSTQTEKEFGRIVDFLIRTGLDTNMGDADGVTPLMLACKYGLLFIIRRLLTRGTDPLLTDNEGNTAMHYCFAYKQSAAADLLKEFTSDENGGSTLDNIPNQQSKIPKEVQSNGIMILSDSHEKLVYVPRMPKKSGSLVVSGR